MKKKLLALLAKKEARKAELVEQGKTSEDVAVLRSINTELEGLNAEIGELRGMIDGIKDEPAAPPASPATDSVPVEPRGAEPQPAPQQRGQFNPLATYGVGDSAPDQRTGEVDPFNTPQYRQAFMDFAKTGKRSELLDSTNAQYRANAFSVVSDVNAIVPTTIVNELIDKVKVYGQVFKRLRKMNVKGGVQIPILSLRPVATWITEASVSDRQKVQINTNVTFSYYQLECRVATSLLADAVTLAGFESTLVDLMVEAVVKALDTGAVKGTGTGQMLGVTVDPRVPAAQKTTITPAEAETWRGWKTKMFAKMPLAYKGGGIILMANGTFETLIDGMVDENGQPVGRVNYGITDGPQERFGGKEVVLVEDDIIAPWDTAAEGDVIAVYFNPNDYIVNSNMQFTMVRYTDHDTNQIVDKAIMIVDGKLADPNGVVIVKKGAAT